MKTLAAILVSALFLLSVFNLRLGSHYCGNRVADFSLVVSGSSLGCGMEETDQKACDRAEFSGQSGIFQKECCHDEFLFVSIDDDFDSFDSHVDEGTSLAPIELFSNQTYVLNYSGFVDHSPPPLIRTNIQCLYQTFLL